MPVVPVVLRFELGIWCQVLALVWAFGASALCSTGCMLPLLLLLLLPLNLLLWVLLAVVLAAVLLCCLPADCVVASICSVGLARLMRSALLCVLAVQMRPGSSSRPRSMLGRYLSSFIWRWASTAAAAAAVALCTALAVLVSRVTGLLAQNAIPLILAVATAAVALASWRKATQVVGSEQHCLLVAAAGPAVHCS